MPTAEQLPEPLRTLFLRQRRGWKLALVGFAIAFWIAAIAMIRIEYDPPLSPEEYQFLIMSVFAILFGIGAIVLAVKGEEPVFRAFSRSRVLWMHRVMKQSRGQFLRFYTASGANEELRLDVAGHHLVETDVDAAFAAAHRMHPGAIVGYSREAQQAYLQLAASVSGTQPTTLADRVVLHRGAITLASMVVMAMLAFALGPRIYRARLGDPIAKPTFSNVSVDGLGLRLVVHTAPGASVEIAFKSVGEADSTGTATIDMPMSKLNIGPSTRELAVQVEKDGRTAFAYVPLPWKTEGDAPR